MSRIIALPRALVILVAVLTTSTASANYNANLSGIPLTVSTYESGAVLFTLDTQASAVGGTCNAAEFAIDYTQPADAINRMVSRLLAAQAAGQRINVGYDNAGGCIIGYIHVYEIG